MATQPQRLRADDLPDIAVEDPMVSGYELVNGELVPVSPANPERGGLMTWVGAELLAFVRKHRLGGVFTDAWVKLALPRDPERVRAPDVMFVSNEKLRLSGGIPSDYFRIVPDLVVEIYSPTNERKARDFQQRVRDYLDAGVPLLWVIYPAARYATIYHPDGSARVLREHESLDGESILPGFSLSLAQLFEALEPHA